MDEELIQNMTVIRNGENGGYGEGKNEGKKMKWDGFTVRENTIVGR